MIVNFVKDKPIETFSRATRGKKGWAKEVIDLNNSQKNGYGVIGDWIELGDCETELKEGHLYLDCSSVWNEDENQNIFKYHLFTVENDTVKVIKVSKAQRGWAKTLWNDMATFLANREVKSLQQLLNIVLEQETNKEQLMRFGHYLSNWVITGNTEQEWIRDNPHFAIGKTTA